MREIKTHQELWGRPFPIGGEWDAGLTPAHWPLERRGRWTARLTETGWEVVFHPLTPGQTETALESFPPTEDGERQAKALALKDVEEAWGVEDPRMGDDA